MIGAILPTHTVHQQENSHGHMSQMYAYIVVE